MIFSFFMCLKKKIEKFKDYLNSKHADINFTSEYEKDGQLPFLDMLIDRKSGEVRTSVSRKATSRVCIPTFIAFYPVYTSSGYFLRFYFGISQFVHRSNFFIWRF